VNDISGRRVLLIGASKGIGRVIARQLAANGVRLAIAARSADLLDKAVVDCDGNALSIVCDVRDPAACESVVEQSVAGLGGLDALIYATGIYPFLELKDATATDWSAVLETNLIGAALVTRAAIPHLTTSSGHAIYLSSNSAGYTPPWRGIGLYITSKTALEKLVRCWEVEHPAIAFTVHVVGPTNAETSPDQQEQSPADAARYADIVGEWYAKGYVGPNLLDPPARIQTMIVVPRN
jgi:NAD(P)-dependent dehydrogenase (short-subunit alcohol dehydrogenase family)